MHPRHPAITMLIVIFWLIVAATILTMLTGCATPQPSGENLWRYPL